MLRTTFPSLHAWGYGISSRVKTGRVVATPDTQDPGAGGSLESISLRGAQAKHRKTLFQKKKKKTKKQKQAEVGLLIIQTTTTAGKQGMP